MRSGRLRTRLVIEVSSVDRGGNYGTSKRPVWSKVTGAWAEKLSVTGTEQAQQFATHGRATEKWRMRVSPKITEKMRIVRKDYVANIVAISPDQNELGYMIVTAVRDSTGGG